MFTQLNNFYFITILIPWDKYFETRYHTKNWHKKIMYFSTGNHILLLWSFIKSNFTPVLFNVQEGFPTKFLHKYQYSFRWKFFWHILTELPLQSLSCFEFSFGEKKVLKKSQFVNIHLKKNQTFSNERILKLDQFSSYKVNKSA